MSTATQVSEIQAVLRALSEKLNSVTFASEDLDTSSLVNEIDQFIDELDSATTDVAQVIDDPSEFGDRLEEAYDTLEQLQSETRSFTDVYSHLGSALGYLDDAKANVEEAVNVAQDIEALHKALVPPVAPVRW